MKKQPVVINHDEGEVYVLKKSVHLSPSQYEVLRALVGAKGKIITRETLLETVYGKKSSVKNEIDLRAVDQTICRLRGLLGVASKCLRTVSKRGYRWDAK